MKKLTLITKSSYLIILILTLSLGACGDKKTSANAAGKSATKSTNPNKYHIKASDINTIDINYIVRRSTSSPTNLPIDVEIELKTTFEEYYYSKSLKNPPEVIFDEIETFKADTPKALGKVLIKQIELSSNSLNQTFTIRLPRAFTYTLYKNGDPTKQISDHLRNPVKINFKNRDTNSIFSSLILRENATKAVIVSGEKLGDQPVFSY